MPKGEPLAILGSCGFLELAVNGGSAAQALGLAVGAPVEVVVEDGFQDQAGWSAAPGITQSGFRQLPDCSRP